MPTVLSWRRYSFIGGATVLLILLVSWVAVRAGGPVQPSGRVPLLVQPTMPLAGAEPVVIPWGTMPPPVFPSAAPPAAAVPGTSPAAPRAKAVKPRKSSSKSPATTKPKPRRTTSPPAPAAASTARYTVGATWDQGFIGSVEVANRTGTARTWTVRLSYDPSAGVRLGNTWNAQLTRQDGAFVLTGGPLAPGTSVTLGFEASKQVRGRIQPLTCTIDGAPCQLG